VPRLSAGDRLRRLLALVPWVAAHDGPTVEEVCRRFGLTRDELAAELDLVFLCGVYPYTPDALIEVVYEGDRVFIGYADYFSRPLRLTPEEGLTLVASANALLAVPGADTDGPLARGLAKLAGVLGVEADEALEVRLGTAPEALLDTLQGAVAARQRVEVDYYAYGRDERTRRVVDPHGVYAVEGEWYLVGYCHLAEAERRFRVDRIRSIETLGQSFPPVAQAPTLTSFDPRPDDPRVVLDLEPPARWVAEQYPVEAVEERGGGRVRVRRVAGAPAWLERLLLRLGRDATVVEGAAGVAAKAACRVLARYRPDGSPVAGDSRPPSGTVGGP
jgi:proteasome accessory factor C